MHIADSFDYPAALQRISAMYADPDYTRARLDQRGILSPTVQVTDDGGTTTITASAGVDVSLLPNAARRFVRPGLTLHLVEKWSPVEGGTRRGTTELTVSGAPVKARVVSVLTDAGESTTRRLEGDFSVSVPLVGRSIEQKAAGHVTQLFTVEQQAAQKWLASHSQ